MPERCRLPRRLRLGGCSLAAALLVPVGAWAAGDGQLVLLPDPPLLLALIALFLVLVVPVNQLVFKPLLRVLDEREERIAGTRARAQQLERDADAVLERYETSVHAVRTESEQGRRSLLEAARGDAAGTTGEARGAAEREIERAREEIAQALAGARVTLRAQAQDLARQAAASVLGRPL